MQQVCSSHTVHCYTFLPLEQTHLQHFYGNSALSVLWPEEAKKKREKERIKNSTTKIQFKDYQTTVKWDLSKPYT